MLGGIHGTDVGLTPKLLIFPPKSVPLFLTDARQTAVIFSPDLTPSQRAAHSPSRNSPNDVHHRHPVYRLPLLMGRSVSKSPSSARSFTPWERADEGDSRLSAATPRNGQNQPLSQHARDDINEFEPHAFRGHPTDRGTFHDRHRLHRAQGAPQTGRRWPCRTRT